MRSPGLGSKKQSNETCDYQVNNETIVAGAASVAGAAVSLQLSLQGASSSEAATNTTSTNKCDLRFVRLQSGSIEDAVTGCLRGATR
jgi:hypothetical protein